MCNLHAPRFAAILSDAVQLFGSEEAAARWLTTPSMGLNHCRPIDLLTSPDGRKIVGQFLGRMKYCIYT